MPLSVTLGAPVHYVIDGHSATNGAAMPAGSTITLTSDTPAVAAAPTVPPLTADQKEIVLPVTVLTAGTVSFSGTVTDPAGKVFPITADMLTVNAAPAVLDHVTGTFTG